MRANVFSATIVPLGPDAGRERTTSGSNLTYPLMLLVVVRVNVAGVRAQGVGEHFLAIVHKGPFEIISQFFGRPRRPCGCGGTSSRAG